MNNEIKPQFIYHYTKVGTAIEKILPYNELKMFPLGQMNDPHENLIHEVEPYNYINELNKSSISSSRFIIASLLRNETFISSFSIDKYLNNEKIISTKGCHLQRMWAQYGGSNTGICLKIDYEKFINENAKNISQYNMINRKVNYDNYSIVDIPEQLFGQLDDSQNEKSSSLNNLWEKCKSDERFISNRLFTKNKDWESESEYRFLAFNRCNNELIFSIKESLEAVILGVHFSRHYLPSILSLVQQDKIKALGITIGDYYEKQISFDSIK